MVLASLIEYSTWIAKRPLIHGSDQYKDTNNDRNGSSEVSSPLDQTLKYTLPTWYRHSHVVHTVDFRVSQIYERDKGDMQKRNRTDSVLWGYRNDDDQELPPKDSAGWVTAVIQALGTHDLLIEEEPNDWYIDERGVFQERGRENTAVRDTIYCGISTIVKRKSDN
ncbi:unnamed protein product [Fusarium graminearum]|uniref:Chromosome 1, complete genome n=1 Tax=Gibberella zeae (strain ATCC MYA-4620 / CBS 123657 / FGSC 9075 / NRRL 31084 / PH-1) TaxID=229533 RepID=I1RA33_GIBZE|nr:hypothetical protein FGSG_00354 [Fusarium graminearum PH-1]ESU05526.1 hypothetical protein FGSG_00354 [Fusarium graminearum PH-1]EYB30661.1 hypothetical protein FG05_00354 [Fusarium graminearum]CEF72270.1 unnamed protein product [Fusarium graminearum]CZS75532.1 unnamed protein product [Fusarium graminearum]|eukprot:XP_011316011.1 hypothetical protein FGSG_00354 [Fusarium graminearum PH-1]